MSERILGITDGQTSGAAIIENGRILAAVNEERLNRVKMTRGFPRASIEEVLRITGTDAKALAGVGVAQSDMELREDPAPWPGWFEARDGDRDLHSRFFQVASRFGSLANRVPGLKAGYYLLRQPAYRARRKRIPELLRNELGVQAPVQFFDHHFCHAASAYYTSPFDEALVLTMDGGGDGSCSHVYRARGGTLERVHRTDSYHSLGNFYAYVTVLCGFRAKRHEGKVTGLAAHGAPIYKELLGEMISGEGGALVNRSGLLFHQAVGAIRDALPHDWDRADLAASIQAHTEELTRAYVGHWLRETGQRKLALAGGLFANVRVNEELLGLTDVDELFVHPGMSDEGLAVGSALACWADRERAHGHTPLPTPLEHAYLGTEFPDNAVQRAVEHSGLSFEPMGTEAASRIASELAKGSVVARFAGPMEYGPRALGNRSILFRPDDPRANDWLNEMLKRTEFMPFAPSCLAEATDQLFTNAAGGRNTARFMTTTFHCTPWMRERCPGVVHLDQTARPQLVRREDNPAYWDIIEAFRRETGVPAIVNTSFNVHEEPIVRSPEDALRAFVSSRLDYLAIGDFLVKGPIGSLQLRGHS